MPLGAAAARNAGAASTPDADIFVFVDDDDRVLPDWLNALTAPLRGGDADLAGGALLVCRAGKERRISPSIDFWHAQALFGGNLAVTREAWELLEGFDPSFSCCEDTDFAWRAARSGLRVTVAHDAVVGCGLRPKPAEFVQRVRWGIGTVRLLRTHGVSLARLPSLRILLKHKQEVGFCGSPWVAALGHWLGQCVGRMLAGAAVGPAKLGERLT
jgi:GT2 family glycosyltransferase